MLGHQCVPLPRFLRHFQTLCSRSELIASCGFFRNIIQFIGIVGIPLSVIQNCGRVEIILAENISTASIFDTIYEATMSGKLGIADGMGSSVRWL